MIAKADIMKDSMEWCATLAMMIVAAEMMTAALVHYIIKEHLLHRFVERTSTSL